MTRKNLTAKYILYIAWAQSLIAMLGSLYFSEIKHFNPCVLCWYQRILMYPLVILLAIGILRKDRNVYFYAMPLSITGLFTALYHILLQQGILPQAIAPCAIGASCTVKYTGYFGFITIPVMSFTAFLIITICLELYRRSTKK
jgi:disulfide bond formation protein DsbB